VNAYDAVLYPGRPYPQTHPDRLAAIATLAGMAPAPVGRCRVLEVACGDASNLIPMALGLPESEFVGVDLAARPLEHGAHLARTLGLNNLALHHLDLADFPPDAGPFDYVIAHGLYSWIPAAARDRLLALVRRHLAPHGVAYVSYNTYPGCYVRRMAWEMLRFHTDHLPDPRARIDEARGLAQLLATGRNVHDAFSAQLKVELEHLLQRDAAHLFHDDLAAINEPVYFHEFDEHAQRHGLQFLGEAELAASGYGSLTASARWGLEDLDDLTREQYLDFVLCRRFRQTLLCHADVALDRESAPDRVTTLFVAARGRVAVAERPPDDAGAATTADEAAVHDAEALFGALLDALEAATPRRLTFDQLAASVGAGAGGRCLRERGREFFRHVVFGAARAGAVLLHAAAPRLTTEPGERPLASPIARHQLATGSIVTTLCHDSVNLDDETGRRLLSLLDGTRTRRALAAAVGPALEGDSAAARMAALEAHLRHFARLALLVA
jgi:SAM-dependent methyltransferase/methyltransferase-like protein